MAAVVSPTVTRVAWRPVVLVGLVGGLLAVADWWVIRVASLAEDPYENFGLALLVFVAAVLRSIGFGVLVGSVSRNPGFVIGIVATVASPAIWGGILWRLPGAFVPSGGQDAIVIPSWSIVLVLVWTLGLVGFGGALGWPGQRWLVRVRNSIPFLLAIGGLGLFLVFAGA